VQQLAEVKLRYSQSRHIVVEPNELRFNGLPSTTEVVDAHLHLRVARLPCAFELSKLGAQVDALLFDLTFPLQQIRLPLFRGCSKLPSPVTAVELKSASIAARGRSRTG
jgi:hypothetical protein